VIKNGLNPTSNTIFTYGKKIYNPAGRAIPEDLIIHEMVHQKQQGFFPRLWWRKYLRDPDFRFFQEAEAYAAEYKFICEKIKDKNYRVKNLIRFAQTLSGPIYGNITSFSDAKVYIDSWSRLVGEDYPKVRATTSKTNG